MVGRVALVSALVLLSYATVALITEGQGAFSPLRVPWFAVIAAAACMGAFEVTRRVGERALRARLAVAEAGVADRERQLRHTMRLDTLGDMAGLVVHQLRNELQVIGGDAALGPGDPTDHKDRRFQSIGNALRRASRLAEQLLELAHPVEGVAERTDLAALTVSFAERIRGVLPEVIALTVDLPEAPLVVHVDPRGLEHALLNLVLNAKHAMPKGGRLRLAVRGQGGVGLVCVRDDGPGIAPALHERIFEPYFTTKPSGEGTGLGLAAVRRFVEAAGARVTVESRVGEGAMFSLAFPLCEDAPHSSVAS